MFLVSRGEKKENKFKTQQFWIISKYENTVAKCTARINNPQYIKVTK